MGTSNLDHLIVSLPDIQYHQCNPSSSLSELTTNDTSSQDQNVNSVSSANRVPSSSSAGDQFELSNGEDDPKTPRSVEHRIPVTETCPPAPRKAGRVPVTGKRKAPCFRPVVGVAADFIAYVDEMLALNNEVVYIPDVVVGDLLGNGDRAKKLKLLPAPAHDL
ncbi:hypothetical protein SSX86_026446 [Deinandra increscens subsp. villosa]|uniref:Uncharacterized protein n=1 Tax=Deinandra increscens subsp. villosa TaxID=3103831 RepID=A0AAP0GM84_9ASTR